jgi:hypothetical protein
MGHGGGDPCAAAAEHVHQSARRACSSFACIRKLPASIGRAGAFRR